MRSETAYAWRKYEDAMTAFERACALLVPARRDKTLNSITIGVDRTAEHLHGVSDLAGNLSELIRADIQTHADRLLEKLFADVVAARQALRAALGGDDEIERPAALVRRES